MRSVYKVLIKQYLHDEEGQPKNRARIEELYVLASSLEEANFKSIQYTKLPNEDKSWDTFEIIAVIEALTCFVGIAPDAVKEYVN